ncbi:MAG TPA: hypothetical protein VFX39_06240 [Gemmatimonadaceae bacterium]|nr:hypothetical protein [Gemmatimonadaceae bacterium]
MKAHSARPPSPAAASTAVVILGADAILAARPATPVQLAHACLAAGYRAAVPATWGDELVAQECLTKLAERGPGPAICCACPLVAERVLRPGADLSRFAIPLASPPLATARYLRRSAGSAPLHLTYVGGCPSGLEPEIDVHLTPAEFLAALEARGIRVGEQPAAFDSVIPPDRRRHYSLPGGVPAPEALWRQQEGSRRLVEVLDEDYAAEVAEHLLSGESVLIDLAPRLGCFCSGAAEGVAPRSARLLVTSMEPPRSPSPVVDPRVHVTLDDPGSLTPRGTPVVQPATPAPATPAASHPTRPLTPPGAPPSGDARPERRTEPGRSRPSSLTPAHGIGRRTPVALSRVTLGQLPMARAASGRLLPRAYLAHRNSRPRLTPVPPPTGSGTAPLATQERPAAVATPPNGGTYHAFVADMTAVVASEVERSRRRLDDAIAFWRARGYSTAVLERARALAHPTDVEGLLHTFAAAVDYLQRLESLATSVHPEVAGAAELRDPERVVEAEAFVDALFVGE